MGQLFCPRRRRHLFNTVLIPSLSIQYVFPDNPLYYAGIEINVAVPNSGSDWMEPSASGPGFGGMIGYEMENEWNIEIGYMYLPVEVGAEEDSIEEYNFGGFTLKCNRRF